MVDQFKIVLEIIFGKQYKLAFLSYAFNLSGIYSTFYKLTPCAFISCYVNCNIFIGE